VKALILVGGEATRLLPLTCNIPKALVTVLNTPFLEHVIRNLGRHQIKDIILAQGHLAQPIEGYLGDGSQFGVRLYYSIEDTPLGTGGAVKNAERYLDETFVMLNGDILTDLDITAMIGFHQERKAKITIASIPVDDPTAYGLIETDARGRITRFLEKPSPNEITTNMINAGTYILEPDILTYIPPQAKFSIERELFALLPKQEIPAYRYDYSGYWMDVGTPEKYLQLHRDLLGGKSSQYTLASSEEVRMGAESHIHPTAQIKGPILIGNNCSIGGNVRLTGPAVIGPSCTILEDAVIEESVIWHEVQIRQGVRVKNSIVANNCCLNANSIIEDSVLGDNVTVVSGGKLEPGSKIWPGSIVQLDT
jgi:mannose-1-phosphate guanylyltransferase